MGRKGGSAVLCSRPKAISKGPSQAVSDRTSRPPILLLARQWLRACGELSGSDVRILASGKGALLGSVNTKTRAPRLQPNIHHPTSHGGPSVKPARRAEKAQHKCRRPHRRLYPAQIQHQARSRPRRLPGAHLRMYPHCHHHRHVGRARLDRILHPQPLHQAAAIAEGDTGHHLTVINTMLHSRRAPGRRSRSAPQRCLANPRRSSPFVPRRGGYAHTRCH